MKNTKATIYTEFLALALLLTLLAFRFFRLHPLVALLIFIGSYALCYALFTYNKSFRTFFSIAAIAGWSALAYFLSRWIGHVSSATAWVFAMLAFLVALLGYLDFFVFRKLK